MDGRALRALVEGHGSTEEEARKLGMEHGVIAKKQCPYDDPSLRAAYQHGYNWGRKSQLTTHSL